MADLYQQIIRLLDAQDARYRTIEHAPEGRTEAISAIRHNRLSQAAKALVVQTTTGQGIPVYWLMVIPGDQRLDFAQVRIATEGRRAALASADHARALTQAEIGAIPPFSFRPDLGLIVDGHLCEESDIGFNAGRLDRSIFLVTEDYLRIANPQLRTVTGK